MGETMPPDGPIRNPAEELLGLVLNGRWKVIEKIVRSPEATGGCFSVGYIIEDPSGHKAFLKALDFSKAFKDEDLTKRVEEIAAAFNFEKDILKRCKQHRLNHVVFAIDEGTIKLPDYDLPVPFLIFDKAEGDIRSLKKVEQAFDLAWTLRSLHQITVGVWQLHKIEIAHQDLKPSNVLVFEGDLLKLADLGKSACKNMVAPHSNEAIPGAWPYAPLEFLYGDISLDWECRRFGCDLYHLGSMVVFFFCQMKMTEILKTKVHQNHWWTKWPGSYREVLPYVTDAFEKALEEIGLSIPEEIRPKMITAIRQLCEPDPRKRGHPLNRIGHSNPYSVERYMPLFDHCARRAELGLLKSMHNGD